MENENKTFITPEERQKRVEDFILNPDKVMFTSVEELKEAVDEVRNFLKDVDIAELDKLQGEDGKTPVRGVDYFTPQDIQAFEDFILDNFPEADVDYPTIDSVEKYLDEKVAEIPRVKGDKGEKGKDGKDGKDGSPDSPKDIVSKIRILGNNGLKIKDINGLPAKMTQLNQLSDDLIRLDKIVMDIPVSMGGVNLPPVGGAGTWGSITGTLSDQTDLQSALNGKQTTTLTNGNFLVGNGSNVATSVASSGDVTFNNTGVFTIGAGKVTNSMLAGSINISKIYATGTPSSTTYLRGDGTWATVSGGGGISLTDLSATTPLTYNNTTGVFGINKADGSTNGYLSSTDWNTFNNKLNASAVSIATGQVAFGSGTNTIGGDNGLYWDNTNKRLGIGNTTPQEKLDVNGNIYLSSGTNKILYNRAGSEMSKNFVIQPKSGNYDGIVAIAPSGTNTESSFMLQSNSSVDTAGSKYFGFGGGFSGAPSGSWSFGSMVYASVNANSRPISFLVSNTTDGRIEVMRIDYTGKVGIGTTTPSEKLHVVGNGLFTGTLKVGAYTLPSTDGSSNQVLKTNGSGTLSWQNDNGIDKSIVDAKGDIITATANDTPARLAVGTDGQVLTADSSEATGLKYTTPLSASSTNTLTNKRITKRVSSTTSTSTLTPDSDAYDVVKLTAQAAALTIAAPTGTPTDGQPLLIQIVDNGTARALTWNAAFVAMGSALPTTTTISKILQVGCIWDAGTSKWLASSIQQV